MRYSLKQFLLSAAALSGLASLSLASATTRPAVPDRWEPVTPQMQRDTAGVGVEEHRGQQVPLNLSFTDSTGRKVQLSEYFGHGRPVLLQLGYFNCPQLCDKVSEELMTSVREMPLEMNKDYDVLYVSVNPNERWELGQKKKRTYVEEYGKPGAQAGWNFLVGRDLEIKALADAVGFKFKKVEGRDEYSHPPVITVLTPDGKVSQYFYNWQYPSALLAKAIDTAKKEEVGLSLGEQLINLCYHYDEYTGKYSPAYMRLMQAGGILTVLVVGIWLGTRWLRDARAQTPQALP